MDKSKRKELLEEFKQIKTYAGVVQITNTTNGKIFIDSYPNLKNKWSTIQAQLEMGMFANLALQKDWKLLGKDAFVYEVLEQKDIELMHDMRWEVKVMVKPWLEKLQPYGDRGYNRIPQEPK